MNGVMGRGGGGRWKACVRWKAREGGAGEVHRGTPGGYGFHEAWGRKNPRERNSPGVLHQPSISLTVSRSVRRKASSLG